MPPVTVYATMFCPFCIRAKRLLDQKGVAYENIDVTMRPGLRAEMTEKAGGRRTVPQIWIGKTHVGGCNELMALERSGQLDRMLQEESGA